MPPFCVEFQSNFRRNLRCWIQWSFRTVRGTRFPLRLFYFRQRLTKVFELATSALLPPTLGLRGLGRVIPRGLRGESGNLAFSPPRGSGNSPSNSLVRCC